MCTTPRFIYYFFIYVFILCLGPTLSLLYRLILLKMCVLLVCFYVKGQRNFPSRNNEVLEYCIALYLVIFQIIIVCTFWIFESLALHIMGPLSLKVIFTIQAVTQRDLGGVTDPFIRLLA